MRQDIDNLLDKYYNGEATLADEQQLRAFFEQDDVPMHLQPHTDLFRYATDARREQPSIGFTVRMEQHLRVAEPVRWWRTTQWRVAASVLLLLLGFAGGYLSGQRTGASDDTGTLSAAEQASAGHIRQVLAFERVAHTSASERIQAVNQSTELNQLSDDISQLLVNTLNFDANVNVRLAACQALLRFTDEPGVREALIQSLSVQTDPMIQLTLIDGLVAIKERRAAAQILRLAKNQQTLDVVRQKAAEGIAKLEKRV